MDALDGLHEAFAQRNDVLVYPWTVKPEEAARQQSKTRLVRATPATRGIGWKQGVLSSRTRAGSVARTADSEARLILGSPRCLDPADEDDREDTLCTYHERQLRRHGGCTRQAGEKEGCTVAVKGSWDAPTSLLPQLGGRTRTAHKARRTPHHIQTQTHTDTGRHALRLAAWVPHLYACRSDAGTLGLVGQPWTPLDRRWASMFPGR